MRVITAAQQAVLDSGVQAEFVRLFVRDADDVFRDLTTYPGFNALASITWTGKIGSPHLEFTAELKRELFQLSLSPYVEGSALNHGFDASADYAALIQGGREVKVEVAIVPMDTLPADSDWVEFFSGRIDDHDSASGANISISGNGRISGRLARQYIKTELVYAFAEDAGDAVPLRIWQPQMTVVNGETYVLPATRNSATATAPASPGFNKFLKCSQSGLTGLTEPVWTTGAGQVDGTAKWDYVAAPDSGGFDVEKIIQNILDDNQLSGDPAITLYTPSSPAWAIRQFIQQRGYTLDAVLALAHQIGWDARDKWREATLQFEFTFEQPERDDPDVAFTFAPGDYKDPTGLKVDLDTIRNSWRIIYSDRADLWPDGTPKRKVIDVQDADSIDKYKQELWAEIQEDETSNIDSAAEATDLVNAALSDCSEPDAELALELCRGFPWVELNDFITFSPNGRWFDTEKSLAVTGWTQSFDGGHLKTTLELRGKPTIGAAVHLRKTAHPSNPIDPSKMKGSHQLTHFQGIKTPAANFTDVVGGTRIALGIDPDKNQLLEEYEIHVSSELGFTPDDTTLVSVTKSLGTTLPDLEPGQTYYEKHVARWTNRGRLIRGEPSAEASFAAAQARAAHLKQDVEWGRLPLNGGFESAVDAASGGGLSSWGSGAKIPDHWDIDNTGGRVVLIDASPDGVSGDSYVVWELRPSAAPSAEVRTRTPFTVETGVSYNVSWWSGALDASIGGCAAGKLELAVRWLDYARALISDDSVDIIGIGTTEPVDDSWNQRSGVVAAPTDARYAQIVIKVNELPDIDSLFFKIDSVRFERA